MKSCLKNRKQNELGKSVFKQSYIIWQGDSFFTLLISKENILLCGSVLLEHIFSRIFMYRLALLQKERNRIRAIGNISTGITLMSKSVM
jgi:hypothetical protein